MDAELGLHDRNYNSAQGRLKGNFSKKFKPLFCCVFETHRWPAKYIPVPENISEIKLTRDKLEFEVFIETLMTSFYYNHKIPLGNTFPPI